MGSGDEGKKGRRKEEGGREGRRKEERERKHFAEAKKKLAKKRQG